MIFVHMKLYEPKLCEYSEYGGTESRSSTHLTFEDLPKDHPMGGVSLWSLRPRSAAQRLLIRLHHLECAGYLNFSSVSFSLILGVDESERASEEARTRPSCHEPGRAGEFSAQRRQATTDLGVLPPP